jgi:hypothetical protein
MLLRDRGLIPNGSPLWLLFLGAFDIGRDGTALSGSGAVRESLEAFEGLLHRGFRPDPTAQYRILGIDDRLPLPLALMTGNHLDTLRLLFEEEGRGGDPNIRFPPNSPYHPNMTLAEAVIRGNRPDIIPLLIRDGLRLDTPLTGDLAGQTVAEWMMEHHPEHITTSRAAPRTEDEEDRPAVRRGLAAAWSAVTGLFQRAKNIILPKN